MISRFLHRRRLVGVRSLLTFLGALLLFGVASSVTYAGLTTLKFPFNADVSGTWKIQQGYNSCGTHCSSSYQRYSFDLVRDDNSQSGKTVYAPISGQVAWGGTNADQQGCISIASTNDSRWRVMTCHIDFSADWSGKSISQGTALGTVAPAGQKGNNGIAHIHITLYYLASGNDVAANRTGRTFYGEWAMDAAYFPEEAGISNQYVGAYGLCSSQNVNPTIRIDQATQTDASSNVKYAYNRGEPIWYWAQATNSASTSLTSSYDWKALGPNSYTLLSWQPSLTDSPGQHWWKTESTVQSSAPSGYYTLRVKATYGGTTSCRVSVFRVR